jgi:beta-lactamase class A
VTAVRRRLAVAGVLAASVVAAAPAQAAAPPEVPNLQPMIAMTAGAHPWNARVRSALSFARRRSGRISFAVIDEGGRLRGSGVNRRYHSASVVKAMLLVAYLRRPGVRDRPLGGASRALLDPMITHSDNIAATKVRNIVGNPGLAALARRVGMRHFATARSWGDSLITPADQARFFFRIDRYVPARHRDYALGLLSHVVGWQRWGIPPARPPGWTIHFKGGWRRDAGRRLVNQVALLRHVDRRVAVAILTDQDPSHDYGTETIRGVATRLLARLEQSDASRPRFQPLQSLG